ncbi:MAG: DUF945 family protein [Gammaproteobacteria bacterium]
MKKWLVVIVVLLLVVLVLAPGGMGIIAEKRIKDLAQSWPTNSPFTMKILSYKRGWFTSNMQLDLALVKGTSTPTHLQVNEVVVHGPVMVSFANHFFGIGQAYAHGEVVVPDDEQATAKQYLDQTNLMTNCLFLHLFGAVTVKLNMPELTVVNPANQNMRVVIEGVSTSAKVSSHFSHISSHSMLQSVTWQDAASTMTLNNLSGHSDVDKTKEGLWLGDVGLSLESATLMGGKTTIFSLKNAQYAHSSKEKDGLVSANNHVNVESVTIGGVAYGPAELVLNVQNVNAEPLAELKRLIKVMKQQGMGVVNQPTRRTEKVVLKMIARGMQLTINPLSVQTPNGELTGQLNLSMPNLMDDASGKPIKHPHLTIGQMIQGAQGSLQISVPKVLLLNSLQATILNNMKAMSQMLGNTAADAQSLATAAQQRASAQLQGWVAAGLLIDTGTNYQFNAAYQQGKLLVNGKPIFNPAFNQGPAVMPMGGVAPMPAASAPASAPMPAVPDNGSAPAAVPVPGNAPAPAVAPAPGNGSAPAVAPASGNGPAPAAVPAIDNSAPASNSSSMPAAASGN